MSEMEKFFGGLLLFCLACIPFMYRIMLKDLRKQYAADHYAFRSFRRYARYARIVQITRKQEKPLELDFLDLPKLDSLVIHYATELTDPVVWELAVKACAQLGHRRPVWIAIEVLQPSDTHEPRIFITRG